MGRTARRWLGRNRWAAGALVFLGVGLLFAGLLSSYAAKPESSKPGIDWRIYDSIMAQAVASLNDLADDFNTDQANFLIMMPPGQTLLQPQGLRPFVQDVFPKGTVSKKDTEVWEGVVTIPLTVTEDPKTRERVILTRTGSVVARIAAPEGYDPWWILRQQQPDLKDLTDSELAAGYADYDPSRIAISYRLISQKDLLAYCWVKEREKQAKAELLAASDFQTMSLMESDEPPPYLKVTGVERIEGGILLTIGFPDTHTNFVDVFWKTNLLIPGWQLLVSNLSVAGGSPIQWTNSTETYECGFYRLGVGLDADGDGLPNGREQLLYGTNPFAADTDGDGLDDGTERTMGLDPLDADTDGDGASDGVEVALGTDPFDPDTDGDTMLDGYEIAHLGGLLFQDPATNTARLNLWTTNSGNWAIVNMGLKHLRSHATAGSQVRKELDTTLTNHTVEAAWFLFQWDVTLDYIAPQTVELAMEGGYVWRAAVSPFIASNATQISVDSCLLKDGNFLTGSSRSASVKWEWGAELGAEVMTFDGKLHYVMRYTKPDGNPGMETVTDIPAPASETSYVELRSSGFTGDTNKFDKLLGPVAVSRPGLDPLNGGDAAGDLDGDGVTNSVEAAAGTSVLRADSDGDGFPDGWELQHFGATAATNANLPGASNDPDGDGRTNLQEYQGGTGPNTWDSDGDLISDGDEVAANLNPLNASDGAQDADSDGISNREEALYGGLIRNANTDGDAHGNDGEERTAGTYINSANDPTGFVLAGRLTVGDSVNTQGDTPSQRYRLKITDQETQHTFLWHQPMESFTGYPGDSRTYNQFRPYRWYIAQVEPVARLSATNAPDYDYVAEVESGDSRFRVEKEDSGLLFATHSDRPADWFERTALFRFVPRLVVDLDGVNSNGTEVAEEEELDPGVTLVDGWTKLRIQDPWTNNPPAQGLGTFTLSWTNPTNKWIKLNGLDSPVSVPCNPTGWPTNFTVTRSGNWVDWLDSVVVTLSHSVSTDTDQVRLGIRLFMSLRQLSYEGSSTIRADVGGAPYSGPHWSDPNGDGDLGDGHSHPVCYERSTRMQVDGRWAISPVSFAGTIVMKGNGTHGILLSSTNEVVADGQFYTTLIQSGGARVSDSVACLDPLAVDWSFSVDNGNSWSPAGRSTNVIYATLGTPDTNYPLYHTVVDLACRAALGCTTDTSTIACIWAEFSDRMVRRVDGSMMHYYSNSIPTNTAGDLGGLLASADGQCSAWAELFDACLKAQGMLTSRVWHLAPEPLCLLNTTNSLGQPAQTGVLYSVSGFLVKNWEFTTPPSWSQSDTNHNLLDDLLEDRYPFVGLNLSSVSNTVCDWLLWPYWGVAPDYYHGPTNIQTTGSGLCGQGLNQPSIQRFEAHFVVVVGDVVLGDTGRYHVSGTLYDPSYGGSYDGSNAVQQWASNSIDGFYYQCDEFEEINFWASPIGVGCPVLEMGISQYVTW